MWRGHRFAVMPCLCTAVKLWVVVECTPKRLCTTSSSFGEERESGAKGKTTSATANERRRITQNWENAFFGRLHYEPGMHEKYKAALEEEEGEGTCIQESNRELFPQWPEDSEAPLHEFRRLPDGLKRRYIINRLAMGERRIRYAPDYGSLLMMQHLNLGELMVNEAERLLIECGWYNNAVVAKIEGVRECVVKTKFEFDLD